MRERILAGGGWLAVLMLSSVALADPPTPPATSLPPPVSREAALEARLRRLEATNERLLQQYESMERQHNERYDALLREFRSLQGPARPAEPSGDGDRTGPDSEGTNGLLPPVGPDPSGGPQRPTGPTYSSGPEGTIGRGSGGRDFASMSAASARGTGSDTSSGAEGTIGRGWSGIDFGSSSGAGAAAREPFGPGSQRGPQGTISRGREGESRPGTFKIGRGLRFTSDDDEFQLIFHDLTQAELRNFPGAGDQSPLHTQFFVPRQRWYFTGRATKDIEYYTVINRGYGSLDLLDAFIDFKYLGPKFALRAGRTKSPVSYEYYQIAEGDLIAPERSIYTGNLSGNRQNGLMLHGRILDERSEYALGVFNGPRRSFQDFNNDKDIYTFFNVRPFEKSGIEALEILNIGGEFDYGDQHNPLQPDVFTTANDQSSTSSDVTIQSLSPEFFRFNNNVVEDGPRSHHAAWIAWYYKSLNVLVQYDGGYQNYAQGFGHSRTEVTRNAYFAQMYYFLTGEQIKRRVDVTPRRNFSIRNGRITGPGAIEIHGRFADFRQSGNVFTAGLSDSNLWTDHVYATDIGLNWYPNQYTKIYLDWQHSVFGAPVYNGPNAYHRTADLVWLRFQLFF